MRIEIYYSAGWLRTYINVSFKEKIDPSVIGLPVSTSILIDYELFCDKCLLFFVLLLHLQADNVMEILSKFLTHDYFENIDLFVNSLKEEPKFKPSGTLIDSISLNGTFRLKCFKLIVTNINKALILICSVAENGCKRKYEVYHVHVSNTDGNFFEGYYQRLQRFLIWYIDGASFVDVDDDRWNYFIMQVICFFSTALIHNRVY